MPFRAFFYVRKRTERLGRVGDDRAGCRRVFISTFLINTRSTWPGGGTRSGLFFGAADGAAFRPPTARKAQHPLGCWGSPKNREAPLTRKKRAVSATFSFFAA